MNTSHHSKIQMYKIIAAIFLMGVACPLIGRGIATFSYQTSFIFLASVFVIFCSFYNINWLLCILIFAMLLSPEIVLWKMRSRDIVVRIEDVVILLLTFLWLGRVALHKGLRLIAQTPLNRTIGFYCVAFVILTGRGMIATGVSPLKGTFYILKYLEYFFIYFLAANLIHNKRQIKLFIIILLLTFAIVNIYALNDISNRTRVTAPFEGKRGEPNTLGGYQILLLAITIGLFLHATSVGVKCVLVCLVLLTIFPFMHTLSRASYMAIIPTYLSFIVFHKRKRFLLISILIGLIVLSFFFLPEKVKDRVQYTFIPHPTQHIESVKVFGVSLGPSASARLQSWVQVFGEWRKRPFFGYGITAMGFLDSQYIRTLVELGAVGLLAFLFLLKSIFTYTLKIYRASEDNLYKGLALGFLAGHIGMIFHAMTANSYIIIRIMEPYWFIAAMVMAIPTLEGIQDKIYKPAQEKRKSYFRNITHLLRYGKTT